MIYDNCKEAFAVILENGSRYFGPGFRVSEKAAPKIFTICTEVDALIAGLDCESVFLKIDAQTKMVRIGILCDEMILEGGRTDRFCRLITQLHSFRFSREHEDCMRIEMFVSGIWEPAG